MAKFQIFTDSGCHIEEEIKKKHNIKILPFYVSLNHTDYYKEIEEISLEEFYNEMIEKNIFPKTSLPSVQDYMNAFMVELEKGNDILCFTVTHTLSGSYQSAITAKTLLEEKYTKSKIIIINSWQTTGSQMFMVLEAIRMRENGINIEKVSEICEMMKKDARIFFVIGTLDNLHKGGRIGKIASLSGNILNIKPIIVLKDGEISIAGVARGRKKAIKKLIDIVHDHFKHDDYKNYKFVVGVTNLFDEIKLLESKFLEKFNHAKMHKPFRIGAGVGAHTGKDTIGICFVKNYECYI